MQQAATSTYNDLVHKGSLAQSQLEAQANIIAGQAQQINAAHMAENAAREQAAREHEEAIAKIANAHRLATDERAKRLAAESEVEAQMKAAMENKVRLMEAEKLRTGAETGTKALYEQIEMLQTAHVKAKKEHEEADKANRTAIYDYEKLYREASRHKHHVGPSAEPVHAQ